MHTTACICAYAYWLLVSFVYLLGRAFWLPYVRIWGVRALVRLGYPYVRTEATIWQSPTSRGIAKAKAIAITALSIYIYIIVIPVSCISLYEK